MERYGFIDYKGKQILYIDHTGLNEDDLIENMRKATQFMNNCHKKELLMLTNFTDTYGTEKVMQELKGKDSVESMKITKKVAVVGVTGIKKIFLNAYNVLTGKNVRAFDTLEAAKDYLVAE